MYYTKTAMLGDISVNMTYHIFDSHIFRSIWDEEKQDFYYSVTDVLNYFMGNNTRTHYMYRNGKNYWNRELKAVYTNYLFNTKQDLEINAKLFVNKKNELVSKDVLNTKELINLLNLTEFVRNKQEFINYIKEISEEKNKIYDSVDNMINYYKKRCYSKKFIIDEVIKNYNITSYIEKIKLKKKI